MYLYIHELAIGTENAIGGRPTRIYTYLQKYRWQITSQDYKKKSCVHAISRKLFLRELSKKYRLLSRATELLV